MNALTRTIMSAGRKLLGSHSGTSAGSPSAHGSAVLTDRPIIEYDPLDDEHADPGEVVWAWVPFEENDRKGKDRPVLVIGEQGPDTILALQLTSKDHDRDETQEAAAGRYWVDIGTGGWDRYRRPSEARVNRLLRLDRSAMRRTGARIDREIFEDVLAEVRHHFPDLFSDQRE